MRPDVEDAFGFAAGSLRWQDLRRLGSAAPPRPLRRHAAAHRPLNDPGWQIARACESILLSSGLAEEAYRRYALEANPITTYLATFRAIAKKYPSKPPEEILRDQIASTPGAEGKWFAAAKDAGLYPLAAELAARGRGRWDRSFFQLALQLLFFLLLLLQLALAFLELKVGLCHFTSLLHYCGPVADR